MNIQVILKFPWLSAISVRHWLDADHRQPGKFQSATAFLHHFMRSTRKAANVVETTLSVDGFVEFFAAKAEAVRLDTILEWRQCRSRQRPRSFRSPGTRCRPRRSSAKPQTRPTSRLDPLPTWIVKEFRRHLTSFVTSFFINSWLSSGCFPANYKDAVAVAVHC